MGSIFSSMGPAETAPAVPETGVITRSSNDRAHHDTFEFPFGRSRRIDSGNHLEVPATNPTGDRPVEYHGSMVLASPEWDGMTGIPPFIGGGIDARLIAVLPSESLPLALAEVQEVLPDLLSLEAIVFYAAGLLGLGGLRYVLKRRRQSQSGTVVDASDLLGEAAITRSGPGTTVRTATPTEDSSPVIKQTAHGHGKKENVAFTLPGFLPVSQGIREVTHDEIHALELGFIVGIVLVWLYSIDQIELTVTILGVFVAGTLGYKRYRSKAFKTVRYEPWYALIALVTGAAVGYVGFLIGVAASV